MSEGRGMSDAAVAAGVNPLLPDWGGANCGARHRPNLGRVRLAAQARLGAPRFSPAVAGKRVGARSDRCVGHSLCAVPISLY